MSHLMMFPSAETCLEGPLLGGWSPQPTLAGHGLRLRPLLLTDHDALAAWACDPLLWAQHPMPERGTPEGFLQFCTQLFVQGGALVAEDEQGRLVGCSSYYDWDEDASEVVVGYTFIDRARWGSVVNLALKRLMFDHAFARFGGVKLTVGEHNWRSRHAVLALGAQEVGEQLREHQGQTLRSVVYAMSRQAWQASARSRLLQRLEARQALEA